MSAAISRYGTVLRVYDDGGKTIDRYTIIPPRWAAEYREREPRTWSAIGASARPFGPQGFGMYVTAVPGPHLGRRIRWDELPTDVQAFAAEAFPKYV